MLRTATNEMTDRLWWAASWILFALVAFFGFMVVGRLFFADYPWAAATDIGVSYEDGGLQFEVIPFVPIADTLQLFLGIGLYVASVRVLAGLIRKRFGSFGEVLRKEG